jgi:NAD(P)H-dependent flavin oxidoreductase YrpB (nitropropane dioxygenase family)
MKTRVTEMLGLDVPIFAFSHCRDVVVEATRAGAMGVLGTTRIDADELEVELRWIDAHTNGRPYALDLAIPGRMETSAPMAERASVLPPEHVRFVDKMLEDAGIPQLPEDERIGLNQKVRGHSMTPEGGMELIRVALRHPQVRLVVGALGVLPREIIEVLHANGVKTGALAGSVEHARKQVAAGIDLIVAQGMEAGAHTGNIASMVLWPQIVDAIAPVPVLAAGGVGRGRQMAAAIALGAEGVWCGSIWLGTRESELTPEMKQRYFAAKSEDAVQRRVFTGKQCRMLRSRFTDAWDMPGAPKPLPMPLQSMLVAEARTRIERAKAMEWMGYYVGQIVGDMKEETSTRGVIHDMLLEFAEAAERLAGHVRTD